MTILYSLNLNNTCFRVFKDINYVIYVFLSAILDIILDLRGILMI
jgi:hypothetical protein